MDLWNYLEILAWIASAIFGFFIVIDWIKTDSTYSEEMLTSSREGELEALTEEQSRS
ncbi:hypothetical protein [Paracoccus aminophilus]|uniref:Uncharacterized protein n=1 Tax=Paracoccus aminophilus JCM 7686 TaxID=1367847 RepID=S5Z1Z2_PARAH|nr:hypothetical protein [Paracoccus aminophilus]AGT11441.1 hypothetical protein JCM7686_pAMI6p111 [Paracoccus aminophilus JCM 7686]